MSKKPSKAEVAQRMTERRSWSMGYVACWVCGRTPQVFPLETHEIERKSQAPWHRWADTCNYFRTCHSCHSDQLAAMPHARQLAYKYIHDPDNFNLDRWLRLKDPELRAPDRVTEEEVLLHVGELL